MVTAYDATFARLLDEGGADVLLVGDSLGMVVQGHDTTLPVTLDEMLYHCRAVARGSKRAHVVGDMPFMSYQVSPEEALQQRRAASSRRAACTRSSSRAAPTWRATIRRIVAAGIPVMGHVGLTPQSVHAMGGFKVQGKREDDAQRVLADAQRGGRGRRLRDRARGHSRASSRAHHRRAADPDDRHRRRPALRRPGAGLLRPARPRRRSACRGS